MTKFEAIEAMKAGHKVRHKYFSPDEWMTKTPGGKYLFEDGVICGPSFFWFDRAHEYWNTDWEIVKE